MIEAGKKLKLKETSKTEKNNENAKQKITEKNVHFSLFIELYFIIIVSFPNFSLLF